jgi:hypothetical protein
MTKAEEAIDKALRVYRNGTLSAVDTIKVISLIMFEVTGVDIVNDLYEEGTEDEGS